MTLVKPSGAGLTVCALRVRPANEARPLLAGVELQLAAGEAVGLVGRSGSGKTTLLHTLAGLIPWLRPAEVQGTLRLAGEPLEDLDPGQRAHLLATCLDRPDAQLFLPTPRHELQAARRLYGEAPFQQRAVEALGVGPLLDRRTAELSSGERQRVTLAVALSACPRPVLLDEPSANLDEPAVAALTGLLAELRDAGGSALATSQAGWRLGAGLSRWLRLEQARLEPTAVPACPEMPPPPAAPQSEVVLSTRGLAVSRGGRRLIEGVDLELRRGEVVLVSGPNGAGKSTLARALAGLERPARGRVARRGNHVALMLPATELQLFATTVAGELGAAGTNDAEQARVLRRHRLEHLAGRAPWTLSRGERQRLVHAALDVLQPAVLIVDEPAQGLDPLDLRQLVGLVHRRQQRGRAYLVITHRHELAPAAHRHLRVVDGGLREVPPGSQA